MGKLGTLRCGVCGDPRFACRDLLSATPVDGLWCPCLETALEARQQGLWRNKNGRWSEATLKRIAKNRHKYPCPYPRPLELERLLKESRRREPN